MHSDGLTSPPLETRSSFCFLSTASQPGFLHAAQLSDFVDLCAWSLQSPKHRFCSWPVAVSPLNGSIIYFLNFICCSCVGATHTTISESDPLLESNQSVSNYILDTSKPRSSRWLHFNISKMKHSLVFGEVEKNSLPLSSTDWDHHHIYVILTSSHCNTHSTLNLLVMFPQGDVLWAMFSSVFSYCTLRHLIQMVSPPRRLLWVYILDIVFLLGTLTASYSHVSSYYVVCTSFCLTL